MIIFGLFLLLLTLGTIFYCILYLAHKEMTMERAVQWSYGSFADFKREFNSIPWETPSNRFPSSRFHSGSNSKIHAGIIQFKGNGMVLRGIHFIKFLLFQRKFKHSSYVKDIWNEPCKVEKILTESRYESN